MKNKKYTEARGNKYDNPNEIPDNLMPEQLTDVGQAKRLAASYSGQLRYSDATHWISYDGVRWMENGPAARRLVHELTEQQLAQAQKMVATATNSLLAAQKQDSKATTEQATQDVQRADEYLRFARRYQNSARISATLSEAQSYLEIPFEMLDNDAFLLNTPAGTVDLRSGAMRPHNPEDYCTKQTGCSPNDTGREMFLEFLERVTCGDPQLQAYLQQIAGMSAIGEVYKECLIIAYGGGGNGKSTLFNLLAYVLGDYAGSLSAEIMTSDCHKNKSPELAELRGRRFVIAAELGEGERLDSAILKNLCSTDRISAEQKYKSPISFIPTHTVVLYTNHLPRISAADSGTWDRMIVIPFEARFRGQKGEVMNYAKHLYEHAGGAVLQWIIDGAKQFIDSGFHIDMPDRVKALIDEYRSDNNWLTPFLDDRCAKDPRYRQPSGELYAAYRAYCDMTGDDKHSAADFKQAMMDSGFNCRRTKTGSIYSGLTLKPSGASEQDDVFTVA